MPRFFRSWPLQPQRGDPRQPGASPRGTFRFARIRSSSLRLRGFAAFSSRSLHGPTGGAKPQSRQAAKKAAMKRFAPSAPQRLRARSSRSIHFPERRRARTEARRGSGCLLLPVLASWRLCVLSEAGVSNHSGRTSACRCVKPPEAATPPASRERLRGGRNGESVAPPGAGCSWGGRNPALTHSAISLLALRAWCHGLGGSGSCGWFSNGRTQPSPCGWMSKNDSRRDAGAQRKRVFPHRHRVTKR